MNIYREKLKSADIWPKKGPFSPFELSFFHISKLLLITFQFLSSGTVLEKSNDQMSKKVQKY